MYSKSFLTQSVSAGNRSFLNPGVSSSSVSVDIAGQSTFTNETYLALKTIQELYTFNSAEKTYKNIPTDYTKFLYLYRTVHTTYQSITNPNLRLLFQITEEGLISAINSFGLNTQNIEVLQRNTELQATIEQLITGVNVKPVIKTDSGNVSFQKTFKLAPLFSYYIMLYGMPESGVGFDKEKLSNLLFLMEKNNIDPYAG
jgi:hypothetical protein